MRPNEAKTIAVLAALSRFHPACVLFPSPVLWCSRRYMDMQFLKMQIADPKSVVARKTSTREQSMVLQERTAMFKACVASPEKPIDAPFLFNPKEAASMTGGTVERQRAVRG
jgi:hypothetical protein